MPHCVKHTHRSQTMYVICQAYWEQGAWLGKLVLIQYLDTPEMEIQKWNSIYCP